MADEKLEVIVCCECAVSFGITPALETIRRKDYKIFYCPSGHGQVFTKPSVDPKDAELKNLREEVAALKTTVQSLTEENKALKTELEVWRPRISEESKVA